MNKTENCCDGIYNSMDVYFTGDCDNRCRHCIDMKNDGLNIHKPDVQAVAEAIIKNQEGYNDVLFLGGEPCLYLEELIECIKLVRVRTDLRVYVTTAVPKKCYERKELFYELIDLVDGINLSVQHYKEPVADEIRDSRTTYDRQAFYKSLPHKDKIRINLNIVKPYLCEKQDIMNCILHYDTMGFNVIKLSELQHRTDHFAEFNSIFNGKLKSPYYHGCQIRIDKIMSHPLVPGAPAIETPVILKRSCFLCENTLKASVMDGVKMIHNIFKKKKNKFSVVYGNGDRYKGWR